MASGFNWYELMTSDVAAAKAFYAKVVGWETRAFDGSEDYTLVEADGRGVGGIMAIPAEARDAGARPGWFGYIAVPDADAAAAALVVAGGKVHMDIRDIPTVGRIAMVADPQGASFYLIAPDGEDQPRASPMSPGHVGWHELHTSDWAAAMDFYGRQFGWAKAEAMDMGPMGTYQIFTAESENWAGGMFDADTFGRPAWLFYFVVGDIDEAADRVLAAGGQVLQAPSEVPGSAWVITCSDPQGAMFALVGSRDRQSNRGDEQ
jgi:predicted enzyme related to lactoylglutathione lyase